MQVQFIFCLYFRRVVLISVLPSYWLRVAEGGMMQHYNQQYQRAIVAGGLAGCALAVRLEQQGIANDNHVVQRARFAPKQAKAPDSEWPVGLSNHVTVVPG